MENMLLALIRKSNPIKMELTLIDVAMIIKIIPCELIRDAKLGVSWELRKPPGSTVVDLGDPSDYNLEEFA